MFQRYRRGGPLLSGGILRWDWKAVQPKPQTDELVVYDDRLTLAEAIASPGEPNQWLTVWEGEDRQDIYFSSTPGVVDGVYVLASWPSGSWRRPKQNNFLARRMEINGVDAEHDTTALQNLVIAHCKSQGDVVDLRGIPTARLMDTVTFAQAYGGGLVGGSGVLSSGGSGTRLDWYGPDDRAALSLETTTQIRGVTLRPVSGSTLDCGVNIPNGSSFHEISYVTVVSVNQAVSRVRCGVAVGRYGGSDANVDHLSIDHCYIDAFEFAVLVAGGQPYLTTISDCALGSTFAHTGIVSGIGVCFRQASGSVRISRTVFGAVSLAIAYPPYGGGVLEMDFCETERAKRWMGRESGDVTSPGSPNFAGCITMRGLRLTKIPAVHALASVGPDIPANDPVYMHFPHRYPVTLEAVRGRVSDGTHYSANYIKVDEHTVIDARGCVFWNPNPVRGPGGNKAPLFTHAGCVGANDPATSGGVVFSPLT